MKRFLLFLVVAIAVVSLGLTIYYFSTDNEVIYIKSSYLVVDKSDIIFVRENQNDLIDFKNRSEYTTISYSLEQNDRNHEQDDKNSTHEDEHILEYDESEGFFVAKLGGECKINISTNNPSYSRLVVNVLVCDGSEEYPYIIKTEQELKKIGHDDTYTSSMCYKLGNNIELTQDWTPISNYSGVFDGNHFEISGLNISNSNIESATETNAGFVSILSQDAKIKNLILKDISIDADVEYMGAFAGTNYGLIQTSEATGTIKNNNTADAYTGGIVGRNYLLSSATSTNSKPKIDRCGFDGTITLTGSLQYGGGVAGQNYSGMISESYSRGIIINGDSKFGGIVGSNEGTSSGTADIYDCYYYMKSKDSNTVYDNIGGITYKNIEPSTRNNIMGNYNGGIYSASEVENKTVEGSFSSTCNGYLTSKILPGNTSGVEFVNRNKFVTVKSSNRTWNFDTVWSIPNNPEYPILNIYSSVGSDYIKDVSDISISDGDNYPVSNAQTLYDVLAGNVVADIYEITNDISLDPNGDGFVWGDSDHPIPDSFNGVIINPNRYKIEHIEINNSVLAQDVGLVKSLGSDAIFSGIIISDVTITGKIGRYVGVLAGQSNGATIADTTIENVNVFISGFSFGTFFGRMNGYEGHGLTHVYAQDINFKDSTQYFYYAGGLVGINLGTITTDTKSYNSVNKASLVAFATGGVVGANGGRINYTTATNIVFSKEKNSETSTNGVYDGERNLFIGGIAGLNEFTISSTTIVKGVISNVYAGINVDAQTGASYTIYAGGITGYNSNYISRAYAHKAVINITGSQSVFVGGIAGYNSGRILNSVVDRSSKLLAYVVSSISTTNNTNYSYLLYTENCSIVGGIAGYDAPTSNSIYSIYECACYAGEIKGYYAGGLIGISYGYVVESYCGESDGTKRTNGGVSITGYISGGLAAVTGGGIIENCYAVCSLNSSSYIGSYTNNNTNNNVNNNYAVSQMQTSMMAGLVSYVLNNATVRYCYCVATFNGTGLSYGAFGYVRSSYTTYCVYQNIGSQNDTYATQMSAELLKGADGFYAFRNAMQSLSVWELENDSYPTIADVNNRFPNSTLPTYK